MKKLIYLTLLIISTFALTSCSNNDDGGNNQNVPNSGIINYRGYSLPIYYITVEDYKPYDNGISYIVELSTNPVNYNGKNSGAYMYLEIYQSNSLSFSGQYTTSSANQYTRSLDLIEFHVDPLLQNGIPVEGQSTLEVYNDYFSSGSILLNNYQNDILYTNFEMIDQDGYRLTGNYEGVFDYIQNYNAKNAKSNPTLRKMVEDRKKSKGELRQLRAERLKQ
ncbi:hypothetical protein [Chishuiella sp.]|uniref:hypothetical protein n=1 Tax=Chishuiella sp. TaxID=1969467 RepID=UPI0028A863D0|nr:hypothetical protein [Chishuiella sp.]